MSKIVKNLAALLSAALISFAAAHATVRTETGLPESRAGGHDTYRLQVPVGLTIGTSVPVPGFIRTVKADASGTITEVTWTGSIAPMEFQRFLFSAANPADPVTLAFKVCQACQGGTVVGWDDRAASIPVGKSVIR